MRQTAKRAKKKKDPAAVAMARRRWKGVSKTERSRLMKHAVDVREQKREERKAKEGGKVGTTGA